MGRKKDYAIAAAMADYDAGMPIKQLTKKHKISATTLLHYRKKLGLKFRVDHDESARLAAEGIKKCGGSKRGCGKQLPVSHFTKNATYCRDCNIKWSREYYNTEKGQAGWRESSYQRNFNMSVEEYERMLKQQGGRCALCPARPGKSDQKTRLHIDHCHATGRVRGLLCSKCNTGLGLFRDSPSLLRLAASYIEHYSSQLF